MSNLSNVILNVCSSGQNRVSLVSLGAGGITGRLTRRVGAVDPLTRLSKQPLPPRLPRRGLFSVAAHQHQTRTRRRTAGLKPPLTPELSVLLRYQSH